MPINNHTVLLKGVNDSLETMKELMRALLRIKVRPYYIFHCDPVIGAGHFRTSIWKGLEIMEGLRGHMSGLGVPTYVIDAPHGGGKIPLMPNYLVSMSDDSVVLRNYEGLLIRYQSEDRPLAEGKEDRRSRKKAQSVSTLLGGNQSVLIPENNERMSRRKKRRRTQKLSNELRGDGKHGCGGEDGTPPEEPKRRSRSLPLRVVSEPAAQRSQ
jgi:lysine 2,3-aminomutase